MSIGQGNISVNQKRDTAGVPPFVAGSANNGLSVDTATGRIVLGQQVGEAGDPAQLLSDREIPLAGFIYNITNATKRKFVIDPTTGFDFFGDVDGAFTGMQMIIDEFNNRFFVSSSVENFFNVDGVNRVSTWAVNSVSILLDELNQNIAAETNTIVGGLRLGMSNVTGFATFTRLVGGDIRVGINESTPQKQLHVHDHGGVSAVAGANAFTTLFGDPWQVTSVNGAGEGMIVVGYGNSATGPRLRYFKTRGANPTLLVASAAGDQHGAVEVYGVNTTPAATISHRILYSANTVAAGFVSGNYFFQAVDTGGTLRNRFFIGADGNIGIGAASGGAFAPSSILDVSSTTLGFLPPRMTTAQKNAIAAPAAGLYLFDTNFTQPAVFDGAAWQSVLIGQDAAAAPATVAAVAPANVYGAANGNYLGDPNGWATVRINGTNYKIPLYT